jgi:hypothetical protein
VLTLGFSRRCVVRAYRDERQDNWLETMAGAFRARWTRLIGKASCPNGLPLEPDAAHLIFQLVSRRYERGSIALTSNRPVGEWGADFGDTVVATAILDRLRHHSHVVAIRGDSDRLREKRGTGLVRPSTEGPTP